MKSQIKNFAVKCFLTHFIFDMFQIKGHIYVCFTMRTLINVRIKNEILFSYLKNKLMQTTQSIFNKCYEVEKQL